jgi:hypothetical protein
VVPWRACHAENERLERFDVFVSGRDVDAEAIPLAPMSIFKVMFDPIDQVVCEADIVEALPLIEGVHTGSAMKHPSYYTWVIIEDAPRDALEVLVNDRVLLLSRHTPSLARFTYRPDP